MTSFVTSVSPAEIKGRRVALRRQRRRQILQGVWRTVTVSGMASGLVWGATQPMWTIRKPEQIAVEGNKYISDRAIRSLISLSYPQPLLRIEPNAIASSLASPQSVIAEATVTRQLLPPGLSVQVQERQAVAMAMGRSDRLKRDPVGLVDANGIFIPLERYTALQASVPLPRLKILGAREQYLPVWPQIYSAVHDSSVKVFEIDWRNPENIIIKTELGIVHLGSDTSQLPTQLNILTRMRSLPSKLKSSQIAYIDLKNPESPAIQMIQSNPAPTPKPPRKKPAVRTKQ
jgi:cell division protein FtsQ